MRLRRALPFPGRSSSSSSRVQQIAAAVAKDAAAWMAKRKKICLAEDMSGLGLVVPYNKKEDVGWRSLGYTLKTLKETVRRQKETEGDRTELEALMNLASIAIDEGDAGAALQLGRNFWCMDSLGDKRCFLANPAKRLLSSAYSAMGQLGFAAIAEAHTPIRLALLKQSVNPKP